jgi:CBS domain-containing protein
MVDGHKVRTVGEIMSAPPVTAGGSEVLAVASDRMKEHGIGSVVVIDGERTVGILTERDLIRFVASGGDSSATKVAEWMTEDPDTVGPDEPVGDAFERVNTNRYRHIPVVDDGELVGVVSIRDLMRVATIQPIVDPGLIEAPKGLAGVIVAETEVGDVRGQEGFYHYRQYSAIELTEKRTLEEAWYLLFDGECLPKGCPSDGPSSVSPPEGLSE